MHNVKFNNISLELARDLWLYNGILATGYTLEQVTPCDHDYKHTYTSNGNAGGFSNFIITCDNCNKQLTDVDL